MQRTAEVVGKTMLGRRYVGLRVHMIGVGGCGMCGAAHILLRRGARLSGTDLVPFDGMGKLVRDGARVTIGHDCSFLDSGTDLVVISAAIPENDPEWESARLRGVPVIKYAELLGELMVGKEGVAIAGTHGKSTTSAMTAHLFRHAGRNPSFLFGAHSNQLDGHSASGPGPHFIVEACEFDRSFLHLHPMSAAILNIEPDHLDCYRDLEDIVDAFGDFADHIHPAGVLICPANDSCARQAALRARCSVETFGEAAEAHWRGRLLGCKLGCYSFEVSYQGSVLLRTELRIPGRYNVSNALAAVALAHHAGIDPGSWAAALPAFEGIRRRLTWRGRGAGVTIVDDYAHHPTEIRVTLEAVRDCYHPQRLWVVFQPHQYARTCYFLEEFARSLGEADEVLVPAVYGARECDARALEKGSEKLVSRICHYGGRARYVSSLHQVADHVVDRVEEGDLVLTMGAGDVWKVADELVERICGSRGV